MVLFAGTSAATCAVIVGRASVAQGGVDTAALVKDVTHGGADVLSQGGLGVGVALLDQFGQVLCGDDLLGPPRNLNDTTAATTAAFGGTWNRVVATGPTGVPVGVAPYAGFHEMVAKELHVDACEYAFAETGFRMRTSSCGSSTRATRAEEWV